MKKVKIVALVVLALVMVLTISLVAVACNQEDEPSVQQKQPIQLRQVDASSVVYDGSAFVWNAVPHAYSYEVLLDGISSTVTEARIEKNVTSNITISIRALASVENEDYYSCEDPTVVPFRYVAPVELKTEGRSFVWGEVEGAKGYAIISNDSPMQGYQTKTSFEMVKSTDIGTASSSLQVRALFNDARVISPWSNKVSATMLGTPTGFCYDGRRLTWNSVDSVVKYRVEVEKENKTVIKEVVSSNFYVFTSVGDNQGEGSSIPAELGADFLCKLTAVGDEDQLVFDSNTVSLSFRKVEPVTNVQVVDGVLQWKTVDTADYYQVALNYGNSDSEIVLTRTNSYDGLKPNTDYTISILPMNDEGTIFSTWSAKYAIRVLPSPETIWDNEQVTWKDVTGAPDYRVRVFYVKDGNRSERDVGGLTGITSTSFQINEEWFTNPGRYEVEVIARGSRANGVADSKPSEPIVFYKLAQPSAYITSSSIAEVENGEITVYFNDVQLDYYDSVGNKVFTDADFGVTYKVGLKGEDFNTSIPVSQTKVEIKYPSTVIQPNGGKFTVEIQVVSVIDGNRMHKKYQAEKRLVILDGSESQAYEMDVTMLAAPAGDNLGIEAGIFTWNTVPGASGYAVKVTNLETNEAYIVQTPNTSYDVTNVQLNYFDVRVCAVGNGDILLTGQYSNPFKCVRLQVPTDVQIEESIGGNNRQVTWSCADTHVGDQTYSPSGFQVIFGNDIINQTIDSMMISESNVSIFGTPFTVFTVGTNANTGENAATLPSLASNTDAPTLLLFRLKTPEGATISDTTFSWLPVANAVGYNVYNGDVQLNDTYITNTYINFSDYPALCKEEGVSLNLTVVAVGQGKYFNSDRSSTVLATRLEAPEVSISQYDGSVSWTKVLTASGYMVSVEYDEANSELNRYYVYGPQQFSCKPEYAYVKDATASVKVCALGDNGLNNINSVTRGSAQATLVKLDDLTNIANAVTIQAVPDTREIQVIIREGEGSDRVTTTGKGYGVLIGGVETIVRRYIEEEGLYTQNKEGLYTYTVSSGSVVYNKENQSYTYTYTATNSGEFSVGVRASGGNYSASPVSEGVICYMNSEITNIKTITLLPAFADNEIKLYYNKETGNIEGVQFDNKEGATGYQYEITFVGEGGKILTIEKLTGVLARSESGVNNIVVGNILDDSVYQINVAIKVIGDADEYIFDSADTRVVTLLVR